MSQDSLRKIHTFTLKLPRKKEEEKEQEKVPQRKRKRAKVYYVEEHVKVLSEIIG